MELVDSGITPYTPEQIINIAFNLIFDTGQFVDDFKIWKPHPAVDRTWGHFKVHYSFAHKK